MERRNDRSNINIVLYQQYITLKRNTSMLFILVHLTQFNIKPKTIIGNITNNNNSTLLLIKVIKSLN